jgi:hypothetical protein
MTTLARLSKRTALACVLVKAELYLEKSLDVRKYRTCTFNHRLNRYMTLRRLYDGIKRRGPQTPEAAYLEALNGG